MRYFNKVALASLGLFTFLLTATDVCGQDASQGVNAGVVLEEIVVTARKREESLQSIPTSVSAFGADELEMKLVSSIQDLSRFAPNLVVNTAGVSPSQGIVFIRGIGEVDQFNTLDPAVGIYIDGIYLGRVQGSIFDLVDVQRIEVLRGPQGTLFGRNTIGGVINVITAPPSMDTSTDLSFTYGSDERVGIKASTNRALLDDKLIFRGNVSSLRRECLSRLQNNDDCIAGKDTVAARGVLRWLPTESLSVDFAIDVTDGKDSSYPSSLLAVNSNAPLAAAHNAMVLSGALDPDAVLYDENLPAANGDPYETEGTFTTASPLKANGYSIKFEWQMSEDTKLVGVAGFRDLQGSYSFDGDASTADIVGLDLVIDSDQFSQEIRVEGNSLNQRLEWTAGVYYFEESSKYVEDLYVPIFGLNNGQTVFQDSQSYAAFAHLSYDLSETLRLSGGLRYSYDNKDVWVGIRNLLTDSEGAFSNFPLTNSEQNWGAFSPKVSLDYQLFESSMLYGSVSRGFRSGGINGRASSAASLNTYDPEYVTSYEIGWKSQFLDDRLRLNSSIYFSDYEDRQLTTVRASASGDIVNVIENAGEVEIWGWEVEFIALLGNGFLVEAALGHTEPEYVKIDPGASITLDSEYTFTPKWTGSAAIEHNASLRTGALTTRIDYSYRSDIDFTADRTPYTFQKAMGLWNARILYQPFSEDWSISLWARNLTDEVYVKQAADFMGLAGYASGGFSEPREYGVTLDLRF